MRMSGIPIVVGVTGHRDLRQEDLPALERLVRGRLAAWMRACPHTEFYCMTSLAEGADQLCGQIALDLGMKLLVPLPMEPADYEADFSGSALDGFRKLARAAASVFVAPDTERMDDGGREYCYRKAAIYVARHCHVLLAFWDGLAGNSGCGTAETVDFKTKKTYRAPDTLLTAPDEGIVLHVVTPRRSGKALPEDALSVRLIERADDALLTCMRDTDEFNRDAALITPPPFNGILDRETESGLSRPAEPLQTLYRYADALAMRFRDRYLSTLKWLCLAGTLLVIAFLFYDEFEANLFLIAYGVIALAALAAFLVTKRARCHRKYIEYRLFAETLRVQRNLLAAGLDISAEDLMPWSQRTISPWIREAMNTMPRIEQPEGGPIDVRGVWIRGQLQYQTKTCEKNQAKLTQQNKISGALLTCTVLFFIAVLFLEFFQPAWIGQSIRLPGWLERLILTHNGAYFGVRSILKILLGIIPALTIVVTSYYGKLSLDRKLRDGRRMISLYSEALEAYDAPQIDKARLLTELAREELVETGDWLSYTSENRLDLFLQ